MSARWRELIGPEPMPLDLPGGAGGAAGGRAAGAALRARAAGRRRAAAGTALPTLLTRAGRLAAGAYFEVHLYLHVPFCARRCSYCDFAIAVRREVPSDALRGRGAAEWRRLAAAPGLAGVAPSVETVYFGGGTPSRLEPGGIARLLDGIARRATDRRRRRDHARGQSRRCESRRGRGLAWRGREPRLARRADRSIPRCCSGCTGPTPPARSRRRSRRFARAGIADVSLDLIFGLPAALGRDWERDLDAAFALAPEHLSLYGLTVEDHTPLGRWTARGEVTPVDEDRYAAEFLAAVPRARGRRLRALRGVERGPARAPRPAQQRLLAPGAVHRPGAVGPQRLRAGSGSGTCGNGRPTSGRARRGASRGGWRPCPTRRWRWRRSTSVSNRDGLRWTGSMPRRSRLDRGGLGGTAAERVRLPKAGSASMPWPPLRRSLRHLGQDSAQRRQSRAGRQVGILSHPVALVRAPAADRRAGPAGVLMLVEPRIMKSALVRQISAQSSSRRTRVSSTGAGSPGSAARRSPGRSGGSWYSCRCTAPSCAVLRVGGP